MILDENESMSVSTAKTQLGENITNTTHRVSSLGVIDEKHIATMVHSEIMRHVSHELPIARHNVEHNGYVLFLDNPDDSDRYKRRHLAVIEQVGSDIFSISLLTPEGPTGREEINDWLVNSQDANDTVSRAAVDITTAVYSDQP